LNMVVTHDLAVRSALVIIAGVWHIMTVDFSFQHSSQVGPISGLGLQSQLFTESC